VINASSLVEGSINVSTLVEGVINMFAIMERAIKVSSLGACVINASTSWRALRVHLPSRRVS